MINSLLLTSLLVSFSGFTARAEDFPFETNSTTAQDIEKGLSEKEGLKTEEAESLDTNKLDLGGSLRHDIGLYQFQEAPQKDFLHNPTVLSLYLDSRLKGDVRGFFRGKFTYDGTVDPSAVAAPIPGFTYARTSSQLDEMKIQFPIEKTVFVTLGIQKIKWGSGHFWNPTDFLNSQARNVLEKEDRRAGLNLIKAHIPYKDMNFYLIGDLDNTNQSKSIGSALRAEMPWTTSWFNGELSLSQYAKAGQATRFGGDISMGLGPVDFILEAAGTKEKQSGRTTIGISYDWQYSEEDFANFSLEAYQNEAGASSTDEYLLLATNEKFIPFQVAKNYYLASVYFLKPGSWQHSDVLLMFIQNAIDKSLYSRAGYTWTGIQDLSLSFFVGIRSGKNNSEMRLGLIPGGGHLTNDYLLRTEIKF